MILLLRPGGEWLSRKTGGAWPHGLQACASEKKKHPLRYFPSIPEEGCLYVDKTALVHKLLA